MPGWLDWVNWAVAAISAGCAVFSWIQARKCRKYASRMEKLDEIDKLETIKASCKMALAAIGKFGPGATPEKVAGLDFNQAAEAVRAHLVTVREHGHILDEKLLDRYCRTIENALGDADKNPIIYGDIIFRTATEFMTDIGKKKQDNRNDVMKE